MFSNKEAWMEGYEAGYAAAMEELSLENKTSDKEVVDKLKPCPFCGEKAMLSHAANAFDEYPKELSYIGCFNPLCNVQPWTKYTHTDKEAIEAWNRRADNG